MCQARNYSMYRIWYHHQSEHSNQQVLINNNKIKIIMIISEKPKNKNQNQNAKNKNSCQI